MAEAHPASAPLGGQGGVSANADVLTYPRHLLAYARTLIDQSHYGMAVIVSHMACEIATERRLSEAIVVKGVEYLRSQLLRRNAGYSLYNERLRCLYTTLTGDNIQKEPFWPKFKEFEQATEPHRSCRRWGGCRGGGGVPHGGRRVRGPFEVLS